MSIENEETTPAQPEPESEAGQSEAVEQSEAAEIAGEATPPGEGAEVETADAAEQAAPEAAATEQVDEEEKAAASDGEPDDAPPAAEEEPAIPSPTELAAEARYSATGKRKSSIARVTIRPGKGAFDLNGRTLDIYFPRQTLQAVVRQPLEVSGFLDRVDVRAKVHGGGVSSQADAIRHGISKALIEADPNLRGELKRRGLLTRDPRVKERRKAGLKKARKRPQFSKR